MTARPSFLAFVHDDADVATLKNFALKHGLPETAIHKGTASDAAEHLKNNTSPVLLLVEVADAASAPASLEKLAEHCDPETKVLVTGSVNEYSFYCWLTEIGISSYLLKPLSESALVAAQTKALAPPVTAAAASEPKKARFIGATGTRGGAGATSFAILLAAILAENKTQKVALVDFDPQDGSIALQLDMEPSRGLRDALERPDRIDNLFLDRVMTVLPNGLSVLSAEESLHERITIHEKAAESLLNELKARFDIVILDLPRVLRHPHFRAAAAACESIYAITDLSLAGLRDAIRLQDMLKDAFKLPAPHFIANRVGQASKFELSKADFEKGIKGKIAYGLPFAPEVFMAINGELAVLKNDGSAAVKVLRQIAGGIAPATTGTSAPASKKKPWQLMKS